MASIKDVAKLASVSESTVSRVVNGGVPVDSVTRERVTEAIKKLNYKPNLLAQGLRLKSGNLIGLVLPEILHNTFSSFIQYVEESCTARGYNLIIGNHKNNPVLEEEFIDNLIRRHVDGIIFSRVSDDSRALQLLDAVDVPIVIMDRALENEGVSSVVLNNYRAGELAAEVLADIGHVHVACLTGPMKIALCRERLQGFSRTLSAHGIQIHQDDILEGDFKFESGVAAAKELFGRSRTPTAVWAQNDLMALGILKHLNALGVAVPRDVSLIGMDDISIASLISPALTTVVQPFEEISRKAVDLLLRQKDMAERVAEKIVIEPTVVVRESTSRAATSRSGTES